MHDDQKQAIGQQKFLPKPSTQSGTVRGELLNPVLRRALKNMSALTDEQLDQNQAAAGFQHAQHFPERSRL